LGEFFLDTLVERGFFFTTGVLALLILLMILGELYPVSFLKVFTFPRTAAALALVAEGAVAFLLMLPLLNFRYPKLFLRFSPTIMTELFAKVSVIFARGVSFEECMKVTLGNQDFKMVNLFCTFRGFLLVPVVCETMMMGFFFSLRARSTIP